MATVNFQENVSLGGVSINTYYPLTGNSQTPNLEETLAAGKAASAWVKTDYDTAACNLTAGHGYVTGKADIFWTGGMRFDVDMTVTVNALALDGGTGDDFPESADTTVIVCTPQTIDLDFTTSLLVALRILSTQRAHVGFRDSTGARLKDLDLTASKPFIWDDDHPQTFINLGLSAQITTRTDDNTGVATALTGHGIDSTDVVDVYWLGGFRLGMVATVDTNAVTIEGGSGDPLPLDNTAVILVNVTDDGYPAVASLTASNGTATAATLKIGGLINA